VNYRTSERDKEDKGDGSVRLEKLMR